MFMALRYLVTVRRATDRPCLPSSLDQLVVGIGLLLVLVVDDFLQLQPDGVPGDFLAAGADRAADEESLERERCRAASESICRRPPG